MKLITVAGPPSSGKTSIILHTIKGLGELGLGTGVIKFDCLSAYDEAVYRKNGIPVRTGISANMCPDHFYVSNIENGMLWARENGLDVLISESAGLCNRCSPHIKSVPAVCVIDNLSGSHTPQKIGPMLKFADIVAVTKGDIVSQAEREIFAFRVKGVNPKARICFINGITGQGSVFLKRAAYNAPDLNGLSGLRLRFTMPSALCSYCMGQTRIGRDYQMGNVRYIEESTDKKT